MNPIPLILRLVLPGAILVSGAASLGYQVVWSKQLSVATGVEIPAILAIVSAFMGGFTLGAFGLDRIIRQRPDPLGWLIGLELMIGGWAWCLSWFRPFELLTGTPSDQGFAGQVLTVFILTFVLLLPATISMGATLPAMERAWAIRRPGQSGVGMVYGLNTLGAVLGIVGVSHWLIQSYGLTKSAFLLTALNGAIALGIWLLKRSAPQSRQDSQEPVRSEERLPARGQLLRLSALGFAGMSLQTLSLRLLSQTLENTVYTYAAIVSVHLMGTSLGAFLFHRYRHLLSTRSDPSLPAVLVAIASFMSIHALAQIPRIYPPLLAWAQQGELRIRLLEPSLATLVLLIPTLGVGWIFCQLTQAYRDHRPSIGTALGFNLFGASMAPLLIVLLVPLVGSSVLLVVTAINFLLLVRPRFNPISTASLGLLLALALTLPDRTSLLGIEERNGEHRSLAEGAFGTVSVVTESDGHKRLELNNRFMMGGSKGAIAERRQAHIPLLLHPHPQRAMFLGVGTGITLGGSVDYPELQVDAVELVPEIRDRLPEFSAWNGFPYDPSRIRLHTQDARRFVRQTSQRYDVVIGDVFHPARSGAGFLYTREHFQSVQATLTDRGLFCQWIALPQFDPIGFGTLVTTFQSVFPEVSFWLLDVDLSLPVLGLVGSAEPIPFNPRRPDLASLPPTLGRVLKACRLHTADRLAACFLAPATVTQVVPASSLTNTEDFPWINYHAPLFRGRHPAGGLLALMIEGLQERDPQHGDALEGFASFPSVPPILQARNQYLIGQWHERKGNLAEAITAYLKGVDGRSPFRMNYARCISLATGMPKQSPLTARGLLNELVQRRPDQPLAAKLLERMPPIPEPQTP